MQNLNLKRILMILLILKSFGESAKGQDNPKTSGKSVFITGITYDSKTLEPLSGTHFRVNRKSGYSTNEIGRFSFFGSPRDTVVFSYMGYQSTRLIVPDTLKSEEYVVGVFMYEQAIKLAEIIILPRIASKSIIIIPVATDQRTMDIAQNHVNNAVVKGLTQSVKVYDADMNAKKTMRTNQMRIEYKGMLVSPENSLGLSTQSYQTYHMLYGSPIITSGSTARAMISNSESTILLKHFESAKRLILQPVTATDTVDTP